MVVKPGKIALLQFPRTDLGEGKLRPVLLIARVPGIYHDWLVAMISSRLEQTIPHFDEVIKENEADFAISGLKGTSVVRVGRLAVVDIGLLPGAIGEISEKRLNRIRQKIIKWIVGQ